MKRENSIMRFNLKRLGLTLGLASMLCSTSALAQIHVNARVNMSGSCSPCDLSNRSMPRVSLQDSNFSNSNFSRSNLSGGTFHRSNLQGASFHKAYLLRVKGGNVNMRNAVLRGSTLLQAELINSDISHVDLRHADMSNGNFHKSRFMFSNLTGADALQTRFIAADFSNAKLDHADFTDAVFDNAVFIRTKFGDADLTTATFLGANFSSANLSNVTGLTQEQIDFACGDARTQLPDGLNIKTCEHSEEHSVQDIHASLAPTAIPTLPTSPPVIMISNSKRATIKFITPDENTPLSLQDQKLNDVLKDLDEILRTLPADSPLRKDISQARRKIETLQTRTQTHFVVAPE